MKIQTLTIKNFRSYKDETTVSFNDLTAFVGRNDVGKSSVLEALDIFFHDGKGTVKLDKEDINKEGKQNGDNDVIITVSFSDLPENVILDETNETTLHDEFLLHSDGCLHIKKTFKNASATASNIKVSIIASHPTNPQCDKLLQKKQAELSKQIETLNINCEDRRKNALMRAAIWNHYHDDLQLAETEIEVASKDGDIKSIWDKLQLSLPYYSLFQSDRKNSDGDDEVQDPLKAAVKQILNAVELQEILQQVAQSVQGTLQEVSDLTLAKLREMNPEIANSLHPNIDFANLKWPDVFKNVSISGDNDIPINKRGSGVKRLVLISFFRAEAERRQHESNNSGIIYAIEEPETSQHKEHQRILMDALKQLSQQANTQVIITTHSADIVKNLGFDNIRLILNTEDGTKDIKFVEQNVLPSTSLNEVNYVAFGDISEEYHNELYGYLQSKAIEDDIENEKENGFDNWLQNNGCSVFKPWIRVVNGTPKAPQNRTLQTYIRNYIHHPENTHNVKFTYEELKTSIERMTIIAKAIE
ncbi:MAG: ATP-binding protein [Bacteroidales bacterium]|nr:ATP-binding protein [Bacteroidales bacterium]